MYNNITKEEDLIKGIKNNQINPYQVYNFDIDYQTYFSIDHYLKNPNDNIENFDQPLNILFFDIEIYTKNAKVFPDPINAAFPIISNTIYSTFEKTFHSYYMLYENISLFRVNDISTIEKEFKKYLLDNKYIKKDDNIKIHIVQSEFELLKQCWNKIHEIDPTVLSGFNADYFDLPYIYNRLEKLTNDTHKILSKFNSVKKRKYAGNRELISIADYPLLDIQSLYKPRSEGGMNYGESLASYSLDWIANHELKLKKLEYKSEGKSLDDFYLDDPENYLLYNIIDVALCNKLNEKLSHIEFHNTIRRIMKTSFSNSLKGSSILFDNYVYYELRKNKKNVRYGIISEKKLEINEEIIKKLPKPKIQLVKKPSITSISKSTFLKQTSTFPGAYVKNPPVKKLFNINDGVIVDLDASSLYPSMILQHNISFDTFYGYIIDPITYRFIDLILNNKTPTILYSQIGTYCKKFVNKSNFQNKSNATEEIYYIITHLMTVIINYINTYKNTNFLTPKNQKDYFVLKKYFLPLIKLINEIITESKEYNSFVYGYLINNEFISDYIYIVENVNDPTIMIRKILSNEIDNYLKKHKLILTLSGTLFDKHEKKTSLFYNFLLNMKDRRTKYKKLRDSFKENSSDYKYNDRRQNSIKIIMNTTYGLFGQSNYRYSDSFLAKTITIQGRLTLKISQIVGETILNTEEE